MELEKINNIYLYMVSEEPISSEPISSEPLIQNTKI